MGTVKVIPVNLYNHYSLRPPFQHINDNVTGILPLTYTYDTLKLPVNYRQRSLPLI